MAGKEWWLDVYEKEKEEEGKRSAVETLLRGLLRELNSRGRDVSQADVALSSKDEVEGEILRKVNDIWKFVAEQTGDLEPNGFEGFIKKHTENYARHFDS